MRRSRKTYRQLEAENRRLRERIATLEQARPSWAASNRRLLVLQRSDRRGQARLEALARQHEQLAASSRLAGILAHELNTPLQAAQNCLYLLSGECASHELVLAQREIDRISTILAQITSMQRFGQVPSAPIQLSSLIECVLLLTGSQLRQKRISYRRELDPRVATVPGASDDLLLVLLNLVLRAIAALPQGHSLGFTSAAVGCGAQAQARITVEYSGVIGGGSQPQSPTTPFLSVAEVDLDLRLSISRDIIAQLGGALLIEEEAAFSRATVLLPLPEQTAVHAEPALA